ncbi:MAG: hypothetical protein RQ714_07515 [Nitrosomonas sp.]|nr:hypothetical protein [Nitrosomonas sp.]
MPLILIRLIRLAGALRCCRSLAGNGHAARLVPCIASHMLVVLLCGFFLISPASAKKDAEPEADFLTLAATLVKDGHNERALMALQNVDLEQEDIDLVRYYTVLGLAQLGLNDLAGAKVSLGQAIKQGQTEPVIYLYLSQAHYGLEEYQETITAIALSGDAVKTYPALLEMKAQSHWMLQQYSDAWQALLLGKRYFSDDYRFLRRQVFYAIERELYRLGAEFGREYLKKSKARPEDYVAIGNALRISRQFDEASSILEIARLNYPTHSIITKVLAHNYLDQGMVNTAAAIMEQAAAIDSSFVSESAELYRRAGRLHRALALNARISDSAIKLKQRMAILLGLKQYEKIVGMEAALFRSGILNDQHIQYALAYAAFATGNFNLTRRHLEPIKDPELFKRAVELRRLIQECEEDSLKCTSV